VYDLLGESMGAAIGLQATAVTPKRCAVAVESPYSTFRTISYERLGRETRLGSLFWRTLARPVLEVAFAYTDVRYGVYLPDAEPRAAIERSRVPALLIAGTVDRDIPMHHAQELETACGLRCELWIVPGADHGGATTVAHEEFERRIGEWFATH
jgi:pimeloyl-ACP methyl ester carboxylesterase